MAQVIFENVYKSFPRRKTEQNPSLENTSNKTEKSEPQNNSVNVLRNINLTIEDGEFMVLVGQSGCGKSTLLRLLAGLETLTGGNIYIGDRQVQSLPPKARDIAMVFQNYALYPHLDVYNNIAFGLRRARQLSDKRKSLSLLENTLVGLTRSLPKKLRYTPPQEKEIARQVKSVARLLQIESLLSRLPKELSGGQKQRVALGRAIAREPQVFLMDEPLSNLDAKLRTETRGQIVSLQKQLGTTTIYVTHDQTEAMTMGDRIAIMDRGQIQQVAKPLEVYNHPANLFVAGFIGSPPMNLLPVTWMGDPGTLQHPQFKVTLCDRQKKLLSQSNVSSLVLGIRPQHLTVTNAENSDLGVTVNSIEALGSETYIYTTIPETQERLTITVPSDLQIDCVRLDNLKSEQKLFLQINPDKIHLFAADTGESIA